MKTKRRHCVTMATVVLGIGTLLIACLWVNGPAAAQEAVQAPPPPPQPDQMGVYPPPPPPVPPQAGDVGQDFGRGPQAFRPGPRGGRGGQGFGPGPQAGPRQGFGPGPQQNQCPYGPRDGQCPGYGRAPRGRFERPGGQRWMQGGPRGGWNGPGPQGRFGGPGFRPDPDEVFDRMDANGDGVVSRDEFGTFHREFGPPRPPMGPPPGGGEFGREDRPQPLELSRAQWRELPAGKWVPGFQREPPARE